MSQIDEVAATREEIGPSIKTIVTKHCLGCPALRTEDWEFEEENDGRDSGTNARCMVLDKHIASYWHEWDTTPEWCPALQPSEAG